jgi:tRNA threonylcarbamoyladenosine biosynthesis protein TsaE
MSMATLISRSPEETAAIGEAWGREAQRGWVIGLSGDLGAGKTQLVKGIARGLGSPGRVHSPTFALLNAYDGGRLRLFHLDLYRLHSRDEVFGAGLEDYLTHPDGIAVVEWIERWRPEPGEITRIVTIETLSETERRITCRDGAAE